MLLEANNLFKTFGSKIVLNDISLNIEEGTITSIIGPSGVGKSTLLRSLATLEKLDNGTIKIKDSYLCKDGKYPKYQDELEILSNIGFVFQDYNLFPHLSVIKNVMLPLLNKGVDKNSAYNRSMVLLKALNIDSLADCFPIKLSGGEKQRVSIARSLALNPDILFFDEPTSALDQKTIKGLIEIIKDLRNQGKGILIVTHDINFSFLISDFIIYQKDGIIKETFKPEEVQSIEDSDLEEFLLTGDKDEEC